MCNVHHVNIYANYAICIKQVIFQVYSSTNSHQFTKFYLNYVENVLSQDWALTFLFAVYYFIRGNSIRDRATFSFIFWWFKAHKCPGAIVRKYAQWRLNPQRTFQKLVFFSFYCCINCVVQATIRIENGRNILNILWSYTHFGYSCLRSAFIKILCTWNFWKCFFSASVRSVCVYYFLFKLLSTFFLLKRLKFNINLHLVEHHRDPVRWN